MTFEGVISTLWISFTILLFTIILPVFIWAVRSGQFQNQERAAYLALMIDEGETAKKKEKLKPRMHTDEHG